MLVGSRLMAAITGVAGLSIFFFGYDQGMMAGVNISPHYVRTMDLGTTQYSGPTEGWTSTITAPSKEGGIVSIYYFGTLLGALLGGTFGDRFGRVNAILFGCAWALLGAALQCSAQNVPWLLCARIINGCGTGILNVIVPVWSSEVAHHTSRGAMIALEFTLNIFGVVVAYWLSFGLSFIDEGNSAIRWRFPIAFQIIPLIGLAATVKLMPESPRWLIKAGRMEEAKVILGRLRGEGDFEHPAAQGEYNEIMKVVELEKRSAHTKRNTYLHMFFGWGWGELQVARRVQLSIWIQILQEWVGIAAVTMWAPTIFRLAGYSTRKSQWMSGLNNITYMLSTLLAVFTIDKWGRRFTLFWGCVGQGLAMFLAGAFSRLLVQQPANAAGFGGAAAFFIFLYTAVFGATWLTVPWVLPAEYFPMEVRAQGNAWGVIGWSIGNGWLTLVNPIMFDAISENTLHIFGAVNILSIPVVWAFYPETSNRTLEEINLLFLTKSPFVWDAERNLARLKAEDPELAHAVHAAKRACMDGDRKV